MDKIVDIDQVSNLLIRPPKFTYSLNDLGPNVTTINGILTRRFDFNVKNPSSQTLHCSLYYQGKLQNINLCLVYLHCNCGSRIQAKQFIQPAINAGYALLTFDFAGCGHSSGKYISLGYHEVYDLKVVLSYFQRITSPNVQIILWGRSMGAVTVVRFIAHANEKALKNIKIGVLDSPFLSLKSLILQLVNQKVGMPKFLIQLFLKYLEPVIQQKAQFKISDLDLTNIIGKIQCPLVFIASKQDNLVPYNHIEELYDKHHGKKTVYYLQQDHNQPRRLQIVQKVFKSIWKYLLQQKNTYKIQQQQYQLHQQNLKKSNEYIQSSEIQHQRMKTNESTNSLTKNGRSLSKGKISLTMTQRNNTSNIKSKWKQPLKAQKKIKLKSFVSSEIQNKIKSKVSITFADKQIKQTRKIRPLLNNKQNKMN